MDENNRSDFKKELSFYFNTYISKKTKKDKINFKQITNRKILIHFESNNEMIQNIFFISKEKFSVFGRRTLPDLRIRKMIKNYPNLLKLEPFYSLTDRKYNEITANMLIGPFSKIQLTEQGIMIFYHPFKKGEKLSYFEEIRKDKKADLYHPFPRFSSENKELIAPVEYWNNFSKNTSLLDIDEECLRDYSLSFLSKFTLHKKVIYDPSCSSGRFLSTIKQTFPEVKTIGQDINPNMLNQAKKLIDKTYLGDAMKNKISHESVDFIFIRFLNHGVVSSNYAYEAFPKIANRCKNGGYIILLGHMPILLYSDWFEHLGLKIEQKIGLCKKHSAIFQYFVLRKIKTISSNYVFPKV